MGNTKIEWADKVWNPVTGCDPVSEGCERCYAARMSKRLRGRYGYPAGDPFEVTFHPDKLDKPEHWKKPQRIFVCSMGDLFHKDVENKWIYEVFIKMIYNTQHTYMILTKRPERMRDFMFRFIGSRCYKENIGKYWPHIWVGVTAENQKQADKRIPVLLEIPAAVRFVSCEPLLEGILLEKYLGYYEKYNFDAERPKLDWVICGGENGPGARHLMPMWVDTIRNVCIQTETPFFFKGWGQYQYSSFGVKSTKIGQELVLGWEAENVGKKKSGRMIKNKEWNQFPEVTNASL